MTAAPSTRWQSTRAIATGFIFIVVLSLGTDQLLHILEVYPPWGVPMRDPALNALALAYRSVYNVIGMYLTAKLAPNNPVRHTVIGGLIGTLVATAGAIGAIQMDIGPAWYPIALAATGLPLSWLGGVLYRMRNPAQHSAR